MRVRSAAPCLLAAVTLLGCPGPAEEPQPAASPRARPAPPKPKPKPTPKLGQIAYAGRTFTPRHAVVVLDAEKHALRVSLLAFEPSPEERVRILRDETFFVVSDKPSPDPRQWPKHMPFATVNLDWRWKKDRMGDAAAASVALHVHGVDKQGGNASISFSGHDESDLRLTGKLAEGAVIELELQGERDLSDKPMTWTLKLKGTVLVPPPPPKPPQVKPEQEGTLGYVTQGDQVAKVEVAVAVWRPKDRALDVLLLPVEPNDALVESHRRGRGMPSSWYQRDPRPWSGRLKLSWQKAEEVGQLEKCSATLSLNGVTKKSTVSSLRQQEHPYTLKGVPQPGETVSIEARGVRAQFGEATSWRLDLTDLKVLADLPRKR